MTRLKCNFADLFLPTGPTNNPAGLGAGMFAVFEDLRAVYENVDHAGRLVGRIFIGRVMVNCPWI